MKMDNTVGFSGVAVGEDHSRAAEGVVWGESKVGVYYPGPL